MSVQKCGSDTTVLIILSGGINARPPLVLQTRHLIEAASPIVREHYAGQNGEPTVSPSPNARNDRRPSSALLNLSLQGSPEFFSAKMSLTMLLFIVLHIVLNKFSPFSLRKDMMTNLTLRHRLFFLLQVSNMSTRLLCCQQWSMSLTKFSCLPSCMSNIPMVGA